MAADKTAYHVLRQTEKHFFELVATDITAHNASDAIRGFAENIPDEQMPDVATYVAVPSRSWKVATVRPQRTTTLKLTDADIGSVRPAPPAAAAAPQRE